MEQVHGRNATENVRINIDGNYHHTHVTSSVVQWAGYCCGRTPSNSILASAKLTETSSVLLAIPTTRISYKDELIRSHGDDNAYFKTELAAAKLGRVS